MIQMLAGQIKELIDLSASPEQLREAVARWAAAGEDESMTPQVVQLMNTVADAWAAGELDDK